MSSFGHHLQEGKHAMSNMNPRCSIIMTSYNYDRFIGAAIESVLAQTSQEWEMLIVDDCSSDGSWNIILRYQDPRIHTKRFAKNCGISAAYNYAYSLAKANFIACLDSDDIFYPEKLQQQLDFLDTHPEIDICGSYVDEIDEEGKTVPQGIGEYANWFNVELDLNDVTNWLGKCHLCHATTIVRKSMHERVGLYDESLSRSGDFDFWVRSLKAGARFHLIKEPLVGYRVHGNNLTNNNRREEQEEVTKICTKRLHPYLHGIGRDDLVVKNAESILQQRYLEHVDQDDIAYFLKLLFPTLFAQREASSHYETSIIAAIFLNFTNQIEQYQNAVQWNDRQRQAWERTSHDLDAQLGALQKRVDELHETIQWQATKIRDLESLHQRNTDDQ
jgi:glycosyltransferase involved in cell wall biosynthesis